MYALSKSRVFLGSLNMLLCIPQMYQPSPTGSPPETKWTLVHMFLIPVKTHHVKVYVKSFMLVILMIMKQY